MRYATGEQIEGALQYMGLRPLPADDLTIGFMRIMNEVATLPAEIHIQIGRKRLHLGPKQRLRTLEYEGRKRALYNGKWWSEEYTRTDVRQWLTALGLVQGNATPAVVAEPAEHGFVPLPIPVQAPPMAGMVVYRNEAGDILIRLTKVAYPEGEVWTRPAALDAAEG